MKKDKLFIFLLSIVLVCAFNTVSGQNKTIKGLIVDEQSKEALAFVNILSTDGKYGTSTDIDGRFNLTIPSHINQLVLSSVGYKKTKVDISEIKRKFLFKMKPKDYLLNEVEVSPENNPAHRIIKNTLLYKDTNDPKKLKSYSYTSYDKMLITLDIENKIITDSSILSNDTIERLSHFIEDKDLLLMENIVEKKYLAPNRTNEKVIASKVSGLKDPLIIFVVSQVQSTSFYDDIIHVMNKNYVNPISKGSLNKYYFHIEDTSYTAPGDTIFSISYQPYSNTNFDGLSGVLNISTKKWAIVNVKAKPSDMDDQGFNIEIQQQYEYIDEHWFPTQLNTNLLFNNMTASNQYENARFIGIGKSYHKNIHLNPELVKREFSYLEVELDPNAAYRKQEYWDKYRGDTLSARDKRTYEFMDSIGKAENFDKKVKQAETILTGKIPWGKFDIPLDKFAGYNNYEGLWLGAGLQTNKRISSIWDIGAYGAYAFKAQKAKYGIHGNIVLYKPWAVKLFTSYSQDFEESASQKFYQIQDNILSPDAFKDYFISRANYTRRKEIRLKFRALRYLNASIGLQVDSKQAAYDYYFQNTDVTTPRNIFHFSELQIGLRYAYKEKYFDNSRMLLSMGTDYPIIWFNYIKGFQNVFGSDFEYQRFDLQLEKTFYTKFIGETSIRISGGLILGDIPYSNLYRGLGSYGLFTIYAPNSFGSMSANEFLSDRYVSLFFSHDFGSLLFHGENFRPEFVVISNLGYGWLSHPESHHQINFKTMEQGYFESGLIVNRLLNLYLYNIGLGATYRYGPYSKTSFKENISLKISLTFPIKPSFSPVK